jgi:hypothetical protein
LGHASLEQVQPSPMAALALAPLARRKKREEIELPSAA